MKQVIKLWSITMLTVMMLLFMAACSSDGDDNNASQYTSDDIIELLTGKWEITGKFIVDDENKRQAFGDYAGTFEFSTNQTYKCDMRAHVSKNETDVPDTRVEAIIFHYFTDSPRKYSILKKGGKNYICFRDKYNFEIISINKTTLSFVMDEDNTYQFSDSSFAGHFYITMVSK